MQVHLLHPWLRLVHIWVNIRSNKALHYLTAEHIIGDLNVWYDKCARVNNLKSAARCQHGPAVVNPRDGRRRLSRRDAWHHGSVTGVNDQYSLRVFYRRRNYITVTTASLALVVTLTVVLLFLSLQCCPCLWLWWSCPLKHSGKWNSKRAKSAPSGPL